ncbi:MAG: hypothetical protein Q9200_006006 [Gallowayella weberi]
MTASGSKRTFTWQDYEHGRSSPRQGSTGSFSSRVHFDQPSEIAESDQTEIARGNEEHGASEGRLRRRRYVLPRQPWLPPDILTIATRRSSLSMRINSLAQVGGVNSLENFARSWQRAASFNELPPRRPTIVVAGADDEEEGIGTRRSEPSPTERQSLLRQQLERQGSPSEAVVSETPSTITEGAVPQQAPARYLDVGGAEDILDRAPYLASPYASSYGGLYGSLSSRVNESSLQHAGRLFEEQQLAGAGEPDKEDEPILIRRVEQEDGRIIEEVVGRSTLPQTVLNSVNVLVGVGILSLPLALSYSGWVLGIPFLLLAALATRYTAGLLAKCLDRFPRMTHFSELGYAAFGVKMWIAMEILITLELGAANVALVILFADSLDALIPVWGVVEWKIACGLFMLPLNYVPLRYLSITSVFGVLARFLRRLDEKPLPRFALGACANYLIDGIMAVVGLLMFGNSVRDEITSNIFLTKGYPRGISIAMVIFIAVIPVTKIPLNTRPIISSADKLLGLDTRHVPSSPGLGGLSVYSRGLLRGAIRIGITIITLIIAIFVPSFDKVMSLMGSVLCFSICIILPLAFYLRIFGAEISLMEKVLAWCMIVVSTVLGIVGTVWVCLPASMTGAVTHRKD